MAPSPRVLVRSAPSVGCTTYCRTVGFYCRPQKKDGKIRGDVVIMKDKRDMYEGGNDKDKRCRCVEDKRRQKKGTKNRQYENDNLWLSEICKLTVFITVSFSCRCQF